MKVLKLLAVVLTDIEPPQCFIYQFDDTVESYKQGAVDDVQVRVKETGLLCAQKFNLDVVKRCTEVVYIRIKDYGL